MTAKVKPHQDITIVSLGGTLDIEHTQAFKIACLRNLQAKKVIFNMSQASFVGSTGIQSFLETITGLSQSATSGIKFVGVGVEFRRLFQNLELANLGIYENEDAAIISFQE